MPQIKPETKPTPAPAKATAKASTKPVGKKAAPAKPATKPAAKTDKAVKPAPAPKAKPVAETKPAKAKKPKLVRDSMTMPKDEYEVLAVLKARATAKQVHVKKTELLRAGIKALAAMNDAAFLAAIKAVPPLKTGRPKKG